MGESNSKQLVVEGNDDKFSVASLMGFYTEWSDKKENAPVHIRTSGGADEILETKYLRTILKTPGLKILGVMLDADQEPAENRYKRIRDHTKSMFPELPENLPKTGLIAEGADKLRFGLWIMPDNQSIGDLEQFLKELVPNGKQALWGHAVESVKTAREKGCPCKEVHLSKANLYTWLAWQDPPGQSPGMALTKKMLDPGAARADDFVKWFMALYKLPPLVRAGVTLR